MVIVSEEQLRAEIHSLTNRLPIGKLETVIRFLELLVHQQQRDLTFTEELTNLIYDDEPLTAEDLQAIVEAEEDIKLGRVRTLEEVMRELGDL